MGTTPANRQQHVTLHVLTQFETSSSSTSYGGQNKQRVDCKEQTRNSKMVTQNKLFSQFGRMC
jgi:hypothetical protein